MDELERMTNDELLDLCERSTDTETRGKALELLRDRRLTDKELCRLVAQ